MIYKFTGTITEISNIIEVGKKGIDKQTFVVRGLEDVICFTLLGKNVILICDFKLYDKVEVSFTITSNCYGETWYTSCNPTGISKVLSEQQKQENKKKREEKRKDKNRDYEQQKEKQQERKSYEEFTKNYEKNQFNINWFEGCYSQNEIKKRYRKLCFEHHPDRGGDEEKMKEINIQYSKICQ